MGSCFGSHKSSDTLVGYLINLNSNSIIFQKQIAIGAYGNIWRCKQSSTGLIYAAKQIKLQSSQIIEMFHKECSWLQKFQKVKGVVRFISSHKIETQRTYLTGIILTQMYECNLYNSLQNLRSPSYVLQILRSLLTTLNQIHKKGCIHMDLKLQNILCSKPETKQYRGGLPFQCVICDFGSSINCPTNLTTMSKQDKNKLRQFVQLNTTFMYRPPQLIQFQTNLTGKVDIWMLGCVIYTLMYKKHPFQGEGQLAIMSFDSSNINASVKLDYEEIGGNGYGQKCMQQLQKCLPKMLTINPQKRYNADQILQIIKKQ